MSPGGIRIQGLDAHYGPMQILHGVNLDMRNEPLVVVGRNGMGKTTLCKAIMGLVRASGVVEFADRNLVSLPTHARARCGLGYVPQGRRLFPSLTVVEHLRLLGGRSVWPEERIFGLFPRLAERRHHIGTALSGGEQQMLAIARALSTGPRLLVMDEPTEGLAPVVVDSLVAALLKLHVEGTRLLVVEQDLGVATALASNLAVMVNGSVHTTVASKDLVNDEEMKAQLLGLH